MTGNGRDNMDYWPSWLPEAVRNYLAHTTSGIPIRELARRAGNHASTVMRQVRRTESRRDDPLVDAGLRRLSEGDGPPLTAAAIEAEARRVLRRLDHPGAVLAVSPDHEKAVVVHEVEGDAGHPRLIVEAASAQALALMEWIACRKAGRVSRYGLTAAGRAELQRLMGAPGGVPGLAEGAARFDFSGRHGTDGDEDDLIPRRTRYAPAEPPIKGLARRRDQDGKPFLSKDLVAAGERLREDFELARMADAAPGRGWELYFSLIINGDEVEQMPGDTRSGPAAARYRVELALRELGPGLGCVLLRCCCLMEGLSTAERNLGWASRSGKVVLRIALQRLKRHYETTAAHIPVLIG
ncbi:DUF6456 domain-containing protein [Mesobacterium pallidum]|uniref:DUF6456 domain-containing protein n=1 Tax=Mesobacterium pallidum TaxID=2872037 RepID=UPI001EE18CFF|nr:DUF6456 domain-containing protein [Mesobacterium pallidum]